MRRITMILPMTAGLCFPPTLFSSKEGIMAWSDFSISSRGIGESGPVSVSGTQTPEGIASLRVRAFGREVAAEPSQIMELRGFLANGMLLSYEAGYKELGGRTVYLIFFKGFTSGVQSAMRVEINERGVLKIAKSASR